MNPLTAASSLDDWLAWFETLHPKTIDLSLNRIHTVAETLELFPPAFGVISIGGTNGKGSCTAYLDNIYREAGYRVGAFTSPHLWKFNERIAVDGNWASDRELVELFQEIEGARGRITLTYFEMSAVAAFLHFTKQGVDIAVLEVGMGGRLDAVNVFDADAALITNISLDHEEWLGDNRELIAREKAGIMRAGRPVIIADRDPPTTLRTETARTGAAGKFIGGAFDYRRANSGFAYLENGKPVIDLPAPRWGGEEQFANAAASVAVVRALRERYPVQDDSIAAGISATLPRGRLEICRVDSTEWVFDVAHNPAAVMRFSTFIRDLPSARKTLAVFGAMKDKDLENVLVHCRDLVDHWYVGRVDSVRSATVEEIEAMLRRETSASISTYASIEAATAAARSAVQPGERVVVFGSFYTVGPAMETLGLYSVPAACP